MKAKNPKKKARLAKPPSLKRWTKDSLTERDWSFSALCEQLENTVLVLSDRKAPFLIARAFHWELDRELGSGNEPFDLNREFEHECRPIDDPREGRIVIVRRAHPTVSVPIATPLPWLMLPERKLDDSNQRVGLNEWPIDELARYLPPNASVVSRGSNDICALEIPWTVAEDEVVEAFRAWLRSHRGKHTDKAGNKHQWRTWFRELAIYRLALVGYQRKEVLSKLATASKKSAPDTLSPQNFARAKRFIREKINWRFGTMLHLARSMDEDHPGMGYGDWRLRFLKYPSARPNPLSTIAP